MLRKTGQSAAMIRKTGTQRGAFLTTYRSIYRCSREESGRETAGKRCSVHWSLGVIRYVVTRCLHGPREPMYPPFWAQVELRKCLFTRQPTMPLWLRRRSSTIHAPYSRRTHGPSETLLHGWDVSADETQRTVNTLVPRRSPRRGCALCAPSLFCLYPHPHPHPPFFPTTHCAPLPVALLSLRPFFSFRLIFPAIRRVFRCHVRVTATPWQCPRYGRREKRDLPARRISDEPRDARGWTWNVRQGEFFDTRVARYFVLCGLWFPRFRTILPGLLECSAE